MVDFNMAIDTRQVPVNSRGQWWSAGCVTWLDPKALQPFRLIGGGGRRGGHTVSPAFSHLACNMKGQAIWQPLHIFISQARSNPRKRVQHGTLQVLFSGR